MSVSRRYLAPQPDVKVIDFAATASRDGGDRFSPPKASIIFSSDGKRLLGVQDRPAVRVLRYDADAAAAAASAADCDRAASPPGGRRHAAFLVYLDNLRRHEARWGLDTAQARSAARSSATLFSAQLGGSKAVAECLDWPLSVRDGSTEDGAGEGEDASVEGSEAEEQPEGGRGYSTPKRRRRCAKGRPGTAPPATSRSPTSLDMYCQAPMAATSPRFKSRAAFEQSRCATPDMDAIKRHGYLRQHQQRRAAAAVREAREGELIASWPHGLPRSELRTALAAGLRLPGVGVGGNPLSMPRQLYLALKPGMKP